VICTTSSLFTPPPPEMRIIEGLESLLPKKIKTLSRLDRWIKQSHSIPPFSSEKGVTSAKRPLRKGTGIIAGRQSRLLAAATNDEITEFDGLVP
jgi:hypothetical protein